MEQLTATSIIALFQTDKAQRQSFVSQIIEQVKEGEINPLNVHLQLKAMEEICKSISENKEYKDALLEMAGTHGKSFEYLNAKIDTREVGTKYDFSKCNDNEQFILASKLEATKSELKAREDFLKKCPIEGTQILDKDTAELITIYPPLKTSTTSLVVTLK